jgi:type II secretory pathway component PulF
VLAGAFLAVPALPTGFPSPVGWLAIGLVAAFICIAALGVAVLALTRELGLLRLRLPLDVALDIAEEGPPIGSLVAPTLVAEVPLTLAIFSSQGCRLCRALEPVVAAFASQPSVTVKVFDEVRDAEVWKRLTIPGSPYAVAIDRSGEVRAKGTFNSYGQLEAILAAADA